VRQTHDVLTKLFHVPMSTGMVCKSENRVSEALAPPHEEAKQYAKDYDRPHADETGWRQDKKRAWLWLAVCGKVWVNSRQGTHFGARLSTL
jgi:transposase